MLTRKTLNLQLQGTPQMKLSPHRRSEDIHDEELSFLVGRGS